MSAPPRNQMGNLKAMSDANKVTNKLNDSVHTNAWRNTCRALTKSFAPIKWATCTENLTKRPNTDRQRAMWPTQPSRCSST